jgi:hypothetical protein
MFSHIYSHECLPDILSQWTPKVEDSTAYTVCGDGHYMLDDGTNQYCVACSQTNCLACLPLGQMGSLCYKCAEGYVLDPPTSVCYLGQVP